jgi:poly(A) polymerase
MTARPPDPSRLGGEPHPADAGQPLGKIAPQPWMSSPAVRTVLDALTAGGDEVRFVGGCVRDAAARRPVHDVDLAIALPPEGVMDRLRQAGVTAIPTGIEHGTVTAVVGSEHVEITTLREDVETDGRHAKVAFTDDWRADAARRDLTINAMSCTPLGDVYDYFGGLDDLARGRIRFVGDADTRISEDALRLLRFFRFYAEFGQEHPDDDALAACRRHAPAMRRLSGERVRAELLRLLMAKDPAAVLQLMRDNGVLDVVLPEAAGLARLDKVCWLDSRALARPSVKADPIRRLASLIDAGADSADAVAGRLKLSNAERHRLTAIAGPPFAPSPDTPALAVDLALHRTGPAYSRDRALIAWADELARGGGGGRDGRADAWCALLDRIDAWQAVTFPLHGRDALALGVPPGPRVGRLLQHVERWWEDGGYRADRDQCLAQLRMAVDQTANGSDGNADVPPA